MHPNLQYFSIYIWSKFRIFEGKGMLLPYRPCTVAESEVNAQEIWTQEVHLRRRAFDHHDTLEI